LGKKEQPEELNKGWYKRECSMAVTLNLSLCSITPPGYNTLSSKKQWLTASRRPLGQRNGCRAFGNERGTVLKKD
jgi:hypothetical protein